MATDLPHIPATDLLVTSKARLIITSNARAESLLLDTKRKKQKSTSVEGIRIALSLIHNREWKEVIMTIDAENLFQAVQRECGSSYHITESERILWKKDDLPEFTDFDQFLVLSDDKTVTRIHSRTED